MNKTPEQIELDEATAHSKYLITAPGYKSKFDVVDILLNGNFPIFENNADRTICVFELGKLVRASGFGANTKHLANFLKTLEVNYRILFIEQLNITQIDKLGKDINFDQIGDTTII